MNFVPNRVFLTRGVGRHKDYLQSFELALRDAGIEKCNLVTVSSIFPPGAKMITKEEGLTHLRAGQVTFCVMSRNSSNEPHRLLAAAVGCAIPNGDGGHGYLSEHHSFGENDAKAGEYAEDLAATMLASTLGLEFNPDQSWDEREKIYKMSGKIVHTRNIVQAAVVDKNGTWTTVLTAAVLLFPENGQ